MATYLNGVPVPVAPAAHKASHQNDGTDEISVAALSGDLADPQDQKTLAEAITPTIAGWNTDPTNLANFTDRNLATVTGTGQLLDVGAETNNIGEITVDLGSAKPVSRIVAKVGLWGAGTTANLQLRAGESNDLTDEAIGTVAGAGAAEVVRYIQGSPAVGGALVRYISLRGWWTGVFQITSYKFYELYVFGV